MIAFLQNPRHRSILDGYSIEISSPKFHFATTTMIFIMTRFRYVPARDTG
jgi:hypothetical protein